MQFWIIAQHHPNAIPNSEQVLSLDPSENSDNVRALTSSWSSLCLHKVICMGFHEEKGKEFSLLSLRASPSHIHPTREICSIAEVSAPRNAKCSENPFHSVTSSILYLRKEIIKMMQGYGNH